MKRFEGPNDADGNRDKALFFASLWTVHSRRAIPLTLCEEMMRSEVIAQLDSECLPRFESIATVLRSRHPNFRIVVGSGSVGGNTEFQGHQVFIDCDRAGSENPEPNCVGLEVCIQDLDKSPILCSLSVTWGGDGVAPCDSTDHLPENIPWNGEAIRLIQKAIPKLGSELDFCLKAWEITYHEDEDA